MAEDVVGQRITTAHFDAIGMEGILEKYIGGIDAFISFLENEWNWKVTYDREKKTILADENKETCICPLIKEKIITSKKICACSEGFAERMFSLVLQKEVRAEVVRSNVPDQKSCIYKVVIPD